ncbi:MAG TPA: VOC family protein [Candidatus Polarisedimenticolia bacterium]|nr:VOC family protein [Candidatus Polarisedimenticolia bacterium]
MIDHVGLKVKDFKKSLAFFAKSLAPLGYKVLAEYEDGAGLGTGKSPDFWISKGDPPRPGVHIAFASGKRAIVDRFHAAALSAGGRDNGAPGLRRDYHPDYYGAFVFDPDGNNIEAVCHDPKG